VRVGRGGGQKTLTGTSGGGAGWGKPGPGLVPGPAWGSPGPDFGFCKGGEVGGGGGFFGPGVEFGGGRRRAVMGGNETTSGTGGLRFAARGRGGGGGVWSLLLGRLFVLLGERRGKTRAPGPRWRPIFLGISFPGQAGLFHHPAGGGEGWAFAGGGGAHWFYGGAPRRVRGLGWFPCHPGLCQVGEWGRGGDKGGPPRCRGAGPCRHGLCAGWGRVLDGGGRVASRGDRGGGGRGL